MNRARAALAGVACAALLACGGAADTANGASSAAGPPLHLAPATDLAQGADLSWLIDLAPRAIAAQPDLLPAVDALMPAAQIRALAERYGGVDPLSLGELVIASYANASAGANGSAGAKGGETTLYLALAPGAVAPEKIETSFRARADAVEGRALDRDTSTNGIVRMWGTVRGERVQVASFGRDAAALEVGRFGPLRVAELFAEERLKRAVPALRVGPLARASDLLRDPAAVTAMATGAATAEPADAPIRAFALGPFEGESAKGFGGLLAASTAAAVSAQPVILNGRSAVACTLVLTGGWGAKAGEAAERLRAAFGALSATGLARLAGFDHPLTPVQVEGMPDALRLTVALDPVALARGARAAMGAEISEIMSY